MKSASEMEQIIDDLDIANLNAANFYIDYSGSNVGQMKTSSNPNLNIILKNGSTIVDTYSTSLSSNSARTRLYLSNPSALSSWANLNAGLFTKVEIDIDGVEFDAINGNNLILSEVIHYGSVASGSSFSYYRNGGGSGGGGNQQQ